MTLPPGTRLLTSAREIDAVSSPLRVEILEHLRQAGASSVADLARLMGRQATAIHYHLKMLHAAGIVVVADRRRSGKRLVALYRLAAERFAVAGRLKEKRSVGHALRTLGATLRLAQRESSRALRGGAVCPDGPARDFHSRRLRAPLPAAALQRVNALLDELESVFVSAVKQHARKERDRHETAGDVLSLTFVLTPAARPVARTAGRSAGARGSRR